MAQQHKYQWMQSSESVTVEVLAKGVQPEEVQLQLDPHKLYLHVPSHNHTLSLALAKSIDPSQSSHRVTPSKVELKLAKAQPQEHWDTLEQPEKSNGAENQELSESEHSRVATFPSSKTKGKHTNWEQLERDVEKEEEEELEGEAKLNKLFQQIYQNADEDTRRAMYKSYIESNGTTLSTNWDEVKHGKVETKPPEGVLCAFGNSILAASDHLHCILMPSGMFGLHFPQAWKRGNLTTSASLNSRFAISGMCRGTPFHPENVIMELKHFQSTRCEVSITDAEREHFRRLSMPILG